MTIDSAVFTIKHKNELYAIVFRVQAVSENATFVLITVTSQVEVILKEETAGRQVISTYNAKRFLRKALIEKGIMKAKPRK